LTPAANLTPVSLIPVVHLDFLSEKFEMILKLFSGAWKKMICEKNLKQKTWGKMMCEKNLTKKIL
jgi:hypothetical protein